MANFLITYDLNGPNPSHKKMDEAVSRLGARYARVLETVWWLESSNTVVGIRDHLQSILGKEDLLLVIDCKGAAWTKLLVDSQSFKDAFNKAA